MHQILSLAYYKTVALKLSHTAWLVPQVSLPLLRRITLSLNSGRSRRTHFFSKLVTNFALFTIGNGAPVNTVPP